jgi:hypothetical protein
LHKSLANDSLQERDSLERVMAERQIGQLSFTDGLVNEATKANASLQRMAELVDWHAIEALLSGLRSGSMGAPGYPALALFKALLLQQWYGLSDPGLEEALLDRLSFRRFLGLSLSEPVPDHSTLWRFREQLARSGTDREVRLRFEAWHADRRLVGALGRQSAGTTGRRIAPGPRRAARQQIGQKPARP